MQGNKLNPQAQALLSKAEPKTVAFDGSRKHILALCFYASSLMTYFKGHYPVNRGYSLSCDEFDDNDFTYEYNTLLSAQLTVPLMDGATELQEKPAVEFDSANTAHCNALFQYSRNLLSYPHEPTETTVKHMVTGRNQAKQFAWQSFYDIGTRYVPMKVDLRLRFPRLTQCDLDRIPMFRGVSL